MKREAWKSTSIDFSRRLPSQGTPCRHPVRAATSLTVTASPAEWPDREAPIRVFSRGVLKCNGTIKVERVALTRELRVSRATAPSFYFAAASS
jgi:hypothetical protein